MKIKITWTRVINLCLERRTPHLNKLINELSWFDASDATIDERVDHWRCFPGAARSSEGNDGRALYCDWLNSCELFKFCYTKIWPDIVDVRGFVSVGWLSCRFLILLGRGPVCGDGDCGKPSAVFGLKFGSADQKGHPFMTSTQGKEINLQWTRVDGGGVGSMWTSTEKIRAHCLIMQRSWHFFVPEFFHFWME